RGARLAPQRAPRVGRLPPPRRRRRAPVAAPPGPRAGGDAVLLAGAVGARRGGPVARRGADPRHRRVPDRARRRGGVPAPGPRGRARSPARRRLPLGDLPRSGRPRALPRAVPARELGRALAPAPPRDRRRPAADRAPP